jgi:2-phospho-L-lactate transferase/gluconeogenesis factor (CofD/UPF0052 family)
VKTYVCNIATQAGETDLYSCHDHIRALEEHVGDQVFDVILCNENHDRSLPEGSLWVRADEKTLADSRVRCADLIDESQPWRHDSIKLALTLSAILDEYTGPLE